jgi:hypothetical protein
MMFGIKLHSDPCAQGSDGMIGNQLVEVKTITPGKGKNFVVIKRAANFALLVIVRISRDFQFAARMVDRSLLKKGPGKIVRLHWDSILEGAGKYTVEANRAFPFQKPSAKKMSPA